jgi:hypothetical protein
LIRRAQQFLDVNERHQYFALSMTVAQAPRRLVLAPLLMLMLMMT